MRDLCEELNTNKSDILCFQTLIFVSLTASKDDSLQKKSQFKICILSDLALLKSLRLLVDTFSVNNA